VKETVILAASCVAALVRNNKQRCNREFCLQTWIILLGHGHRRCLFPYTVSHGHLVIWSSALSSNTLWLVTKIKKNNAAWWSSASSGRFLVYSDTFQHLTSAMGNAKQFASVDTKADLHLGLFFFFSGPFL